MATIVFHDKDGAAKRVEVGTGTSVMAAAVTHGVSGIVAECGGNLMCATCHVYVEDQAGLPPMTGDEDALLDGVAAERRPTSRLSCQLTVSETTHALEVELPERQT